MLSRWPIRKKLTLGLSMLIVLLVLMTVSGISSIYKYRGLARGVSRRAAELPLASDFAQHVSDLRVTFTLVTTEPNLSLSSSPFYDRLELRQRFRADLNMARAKIREYRELFHENQEIEELDWRSDSSQREGLTLHNIERTLATIERECPTSEEWAFNTIKVDDLREKLVSLQDLSKDLPSCLQDRMTSFKDDVTLEYRAAIVATWSTLIVALAVLGLLGRLLYVWVLKPLRDLLRGSRRVAAGDFDHRIQVSSQDEIAELANAMNEMTQRFREIRDDLDGQVRQRTKEVVRSEQMASVGFLAAGVAHEINNPLAAIALCAESLEDRLQGIIQIDDALPDEEHDQEVTVCRNYLRVMQDEAFRCKEITEKLLDFARIGEVQCQATDLGSVVQSVIEMVGHLGKYKQKAVSCQVDEAVIASVNVQEFKQVVLNLVTNALDSLDAGGKVAVTLQKRGAQAVLQVVDDGCGMCAEVIQHIFEPFFTRRRDGQGTGLGMSITYRIVNEHGGTIAAESDGKNKGSRLTVTLPLAIAEARKESDHRYKAA